MIQLIILAYVWQFIIENRLVKYLAVTEDVQSGPQISGCAVAQGDDNEVRTTTKITFLNFSSGDKNIGWNWSGWPRILAWAVTEDEFHYRLSFINEHFMIQFWPTSTWDIKLELKHLLFCCILWPPSVATTSGFVEARLWLVTTSRVRSSFSFWRISPLPPSLNLYKTAISYLISVGLIWVKTEMLHLNEIYNQKCLWKFNFYPKHKLKWPVL